MRAFPHVQAWARHYILSADLDDKLVPPPLPRNNHPDPQPERIAAPGRPPLLQPAPRRERAPKPEALREPRFRAKLMHAFFHHELQAAELMCWALLAFPHTPQAFRTGLMGICKDEIRHMHMYRAHIEKLGFALGDFPIRDWFWKRVPLCKDPTGFVAFMGMGLEGANLDFAPTFADRFRAAGDEEGAAIQEQVAREEIPHVRFATHWFSVWTGGCDFHTWMQHLPPPLSPAVLRGNPIAGATRVSAGMPTAFVEALKDYVPEPRGAEALSQGPGDD